MEDKMISKNDLIKKLNEIEENYRAEICERDCMQDDPFSDGILSAMFTVIQIVKQM